MDCHSAWMVNATTACARFVTVGMNLDGTLQRKTQVVVLWGAPGREVMEVYRLSSSAPGKVTAEVYTWDCGTWSAPRKHRRKYDDPPLPPSGTSVEVVDGIQYWTIRPMTAPEKDRVRELSRARRKRPNG